MTKNQTPEQQPNAEPGDAGSNPEGNPGIGAQGVSDDIGDAIGGTGAAESSGEMEDSPTDGLPEKMPFESQPGPPDLDTPIETENETEQFDDDGAASHGESDAGAGEPAEQSLSPELEVVRLQEQLAASEAQHKDDVLRIHAEMENVRKRSDVQAQKGRQFAIESFAKELLEVKDSLEMGIDAAKADGADIGQFIEGSDLTLKKLAQAFEKNNIVEIDPLGEKFNPELHEAMTHQPADGNEPNTVMVVIQKGYELNGRIIRPARVIVAK